MPCGARRVALRLLALPSVRDTELAMVRTLAVEVAPVLVAAGQHETANQVLRDAVRDVRRLGIMMADGRVLGARNPGAAL